MGANYAEAAFVQWSHLPHAAHRALVRMALVAKDSDPAPVYWGGWRTLAHGLGCDMPHDSDTSPEADRLRDNAQRKVARVVSHLVREGAISRDRRGGIGRQAEYVLHLRPVDKSAYRERDG